MRNSSPLLLGSGAPHTRKPVSRHFEANGSRPSASPSYPEPDSGSSPVAAPHWQTTHSRNPWQRDGLLGGGGALAERSIRGSAATLHQLPSMVSCHLCLKKSVFPDQQHKRRYLRAEDIPTDASGTGRSFGTETRIDTCIDSHSLLSRPGCNTSQPSK